MIDYAVIGGGISGAYSAWRLKSAYPDKKVVLYEYSDRIGGKFLTVQLPKMPDVNAELGGMRYIPKAHKLMAAVIGEMGLETRDFPMGEGDDHTGLRNFAYLRGRHMLVGEMKDSSKAPYDLDWSEQGLMPDALQAKLLDVLIPENAKFSEEDWFNVEVLGKPLWKWGLWNLLYKVLSPEAYQFLRSGSGYDTNVSNGNAVALFPTGSDYDGSTEYKTVVKGMEAVPVSLAEAFEKLGGPVKTNQRLDSIAKTGEDEYKLTFCATETSSAKTRDCHPAELTEETARNVILAMPRFALEQIKWDQWWKNPFLRENIPAVLKQTAFKMVLGYETPWWRSLGLVAGRSITDLPIRQTLYFESQGSDNPLTNRSLLMSSYNDITTIPYWKGMENDAPFGDGPDGYQATVSMVEEAQSQVAELHGQRELPKPYAAACRDWSEAPFGAGWHAWKAGFKYNEIIPKMTHPVEDENVFICGEAYSNDQGWGEGALETAEEMLTKALNVPKHKCTEYWKPDKLRRLRY